MMLIEKLKKYQHYVKGAEILNPEQKRPKEQPKFTYSPLEKDFEQEIEASWSFKSFKSSRTSMKGKINSINFSKIIMKQGK